MTWTLACIGYNVRLPRRLRFWNKGYFVNNKLPRALGLLLFLVSLCALSSGLEHNGLLGSRVSSKRFHRRSRWNPMFRPSRESLLRQNAEIDRAELPRIQDDDELETLKASQALVPIVASEHLRFDPRLDPDRRYCRPWTRDFVQDLADSFYKEFHDSIQINSAVRTVQVQQKLRRHNRNAAPEKGEIASSHLAGITVDIQRRGLSREQIKFVQQYMLPLKNMGLIEPEEERHQWVFHVMVSGRYTEWRDAETSALAVQQNTAPTLATDEASAAQ
jgi:hypothetical protein